jgi:Fur family transcriptional regulator, ferric uptake regulator
VSTGDASPAPSDWQATLRSRGHRLTAQRQLVLQAVTELGHATPEDVCSKVRETAQGVNITTVYRNLELLEELGVVRHVHFGHGPSVYGLIGDGEREYLVCESCGKVRAIRPEQLDAAREAIRDAFGYEARFTHFPIHGLCADCAE